MHRPTRGSRNENHGQKAANSRRGTWHTANTPRSPEGTATTQTLRIHGRWIRQVEIWCASTMTSFDVHQHLWPPSFVAALAEREVEPYLEGTILHCSEGSSETDLDAHDLGTRLALLDRYGIDVAVVSLQPSLGFQLLDDTDRDHLEQIWEEGILEITAAANGRIRALSVRRPRAGFFGVTVGTESLTDIDAIETTLDALRGGGYLFVHPVASSPHPDAPAWWPAVVEYTGHMQEAYFFWLAHCQERWPDVNVVFAIGAGGGPIQLERLESRGIEISTARHDNIFYDTASYGHRGLDLEIDLFGSEQMVFGTDTPVVSTAVGCEALSELGESTARQIRVQSPLRLFR